MTLKHFIILGLLFTGVNVGSYAQFYPVQVTPQLVPPYSVYLSDYATPGSEKLRVIVLQRDLTQPAYQLRLVMSVEWNGKVIMRTSKAFNSPPINIDPGIPTVISGADLAPYLDSRNIDFVGYSRDQYEKTRALPEGSYRIFFTAYDYRRQDVQVSNEGSSFYYLSKNEPPLINFPACGTKIPLKTPQQIVFSWLPRNTASPNSVAETEYEFALYETRPAGRNPNDVVLSTQPVFRTRIDIPQLVYGPAEPVLLENMKYVWRVQAIDKNGRDAFRNNGFSEVCTFTYGGVDPTFDIGVVKNLQAVGETERRGKISWEAANYDSYKVYYKKTGTGYEWFSSDIKNTELKLFDLEPDTEYETRVQVRKSGVFGPYSEIVKFRTTPRRVLACGQDAGTLAQGDESKPLLAATRGMTIDVDGMEVMLLDVAPLGSGWYKGMGTVTTKLLGASFHVKFDRLFIDDSHVAGFGKIEFLTKGVAELVQQQIANQQRKNDQKQQEENRSQWEGTDFQEKIFRYDNIVIADISFENGVMVITDAEGKTYENTEIPQLLVDAPEKAIIIEDKNGDQYVVQKDPATGETKATKVEGGGLSAGESNLQEVVESSKVDPSYFITIPNDTAKYRHNNVFTFIRQNNKILLTINGYADSIKTKIIWKINGKESCKGVPSCDVDLSNSGTIKVEVLLEKVTLIKVSVNIYRKPVIVFERGNNYAGEYGFDDGHKFTPIQSDYTKLTIEGSDYYVNWLSLLDGQTVYIKVNINGLKNDALKDKNFKVTLRPSHNNIRINDSTQITLSYNDLQNPSPIKIFCTSLPGSPNYVTPEKIEVLDYKGDLIGQINVVCSNAEIRRVVFIYVDKGKGYATNTITKQSLLDFLNIKSHNQFYRRWELDPDPAFPDTLNIRQRYKKNPSGFTSSSAATLDSLVTYYKSSINATRLKPGTHFFFINDIPISRPNANGGTDYVRGIADTNGYRGTVFDGGTQEETAHELGHNLRLNHTFEGARIILRGTTKNYMDYTSGGRYMFFLYQWREVTQR